MDAWSGWVFSHRVLMRCAVLCCASVVLEVLIPIPWMIRMLWRTGERKPGAGGGGADLGACLPAISPPVLTGEWRCPEPQVSQGWVLMTARVTPSPSDSPERPADTLQLPTWLWFSPVRYSWAQRLNDHMCTKLICRIQSVRIISEMSFNLILFNV